jgi:hypothetical protein
MEGVLFETRRFEPRRFPDEQPMRVSAPEPSSAPSASTVLYKPTAYVFRNPSQIPRRQFVYGKHLTRGSVSATVAPGGVGKSSLKLVDAVAMAVGRNLLGDKPIAPLRVWYINLEDERVEVERRVAAICLYFNINAEDLAAISQT